jgi:hypothetical protein
MSDIMYDAQRSEKVREICLVGPPSTSIFSGIAAIANALDVQVLAI